MNKPEKLRGILVQFFWVNAINLSYCLADIRKMASSIRAHPKLIKNAGNVAGNFLYHRRIWSDSLAHNFNFNYNISFYYIPLFNRNRDRKHSPLAKGRINCNFSAMFFFDYLTNNFLMVQAPGFIREVNLKSKI
jgi:hypothetical protein